MVQFDAHRQTLLGQAGALTIAQNDEMARKFIMLLEGECEGLGPSKAAAKFGYTRQRYFQIRTAFAAEGSTALLSRTRGPKRNYRRTSEVVRQVIRYRFLDSDASADVIAQALRQAGWTVSVRSVERVIQDYGLQKKTLQMPPSRRRRTRLLG